MEQTQAIFLLPIVSYIVFLRWHAVCMAEAKLALNAGGFKSAPEQFDQKNQ